MMSRADDLAILEMLDARDRLGLRGAKLRAHLRTVTGQHWSNSRIQGLVKRDRDDAQPCRCRKAKNKDGGMPERWWDMRQAT